MRQILAPLINLLRGDHAGFIGAVFFFVLALLWVLFGFWDMLFIMLMSFLGYYLGMRFFRRNDQFKELMDKLFPPGRFR